MAKYRFRKMYFICENKRVIASNAHLTSAYQYKHDADAVFAQNGKPVKMWAVNNPPVLNSVEGFYLVHESLYDEILKAHCK